MDQLSVMRTFYDMAARCAHAKREDWTITCMLAKNYCSPRSCPLPGMWHHLPQVEKERKNPVEVEKEPKIKAKLGPKIKTPEKPKLQFKIKKKRPYTPHRPSVKKGKVRRCLVTFHDKRGELSRWGYTAVLTSARKKTPLTREYPGNVQRFYFPEDADEQQITSYVGSWFLAQHLHDENKPVQAGSPELVRVELY